MLRLEAAEVESPLRWLETLVNPHVLHSARRASLAIQLRWDLSRLLLPQSEPPHCNFLTRPASHLSALTHRQAAYGRWPGQHASHYFPGRFDRASFVLSPLPQIPSERRQDGHSAVLRCGDVWLKCSISVTHSRGFFPVAVSEVLMPPYIHRGLPACPLADFLR